MAEWVELDDCGALVTIFRDGFPVASFEGGRSRNGSGHAQAAPVGARLGLAVAQVDASSTSGLFAGLRGRALIYAHSGCL